MALPLRRRSDLDRPGNVLLRALVIDDDEDSRTLIAAMLRRLGFDCVTASDGRHALEVIEHRSFDLFVIDCEMPRIGGMELIAELRAQDATSDVYALMLTGREDADTKIVALRLGFDDFLVKSTSEAEIVAKLGATRRLIQRQRRLDDAVTELYGLATRDELTGLYNRRYFFTETERILAEGRPVHIVLLDLNDFKQINDTYGHLAGDRILHDVGGLFLRRTRGIDIIARYGGDEFVMLVQNATIAEAEHVAARLAAEVASMEWTFSDQQVRITMSTGISSSVTLGKPTISELLNAGDRDLYKSKWLRRHPGADPSIYQYPEGRAEEIASVINFPVNETQRNAAD